MAKYRRDSAKEASWRKALKRQASSGLTVRAFCQREGLGESAFHFWRRTIRQRDEDAARDTNDKRHTKGKPVPKTPAFVPAVVNSESQRDESLVLKLAGGLELRLPSSISAQRLAELAHALEARAER